MTASNRTYKSARRLRRTLSLPENLLWVRLRGTTPRIRRQHPIGAYILKFHCPAAKLAIEVPRSLRCLSRRQRCHYRRWSTIVSLAVLGVAGAKAGGAHALAAALRVVLWGSLAMAITLAAGRFFHATI